MKIKFLLGLVLGLGIASMSHAITIENHTDYPIMVSYHFHNCLSKTRWGVFLGPQKTPENPNSRDRIYQDITCDLAWVEYHVNFDGNATASALDQPGNVWQFMSRETRRVNIPQKVIFSEGKDRVGNPTVKMFIF